MIGSAKPYTTKLQPAPKRPMSGAITNTITKKS